MREIRVHKAEPVVRSDTVDSVVLWLVMQLPGDLDHLVGVYAEDARKIAEVLIGTLPGGTVDRLLAELMTRRAVLLRTPLPPPRPEGGGS